MIVRPAGWGVEVIRQADHARLAGQMIALFRRPELIDHPRRARLLRAISEHDNGWWEEDAAPRLDPATGGPLDFRAVPDEVRWEVWQRSVDRLAEDDPYVAALVAGHFLRLARTRFVGDEWDEFERREETRRLELLTTAEIELEEAAADDRWLELGDALSLAVCTGAPGFLIPPGRQVELGGAEELAELRLDPFPLAGATRFEIELRRLPASRFEDGVALGVALAGTVPLRRVVRLASA